MATIRAYTTIEQSRKLAEILPHESADMYYEWPNKKVHFKDDKYSGMGFSCWSLAALIGVLPYGYSSILTKCFDGKDYYCNIDGKHIETMADNPVDACYEMILKLNELKLL